MVNSRILIRGKIDKEPIVNEDGSVKLILTNEIESNADKDIKAKGKSLFLVRVSKRQWAHIRKKIMNPENTVEVLGRIKAGVNKKGIPFTYVSTITITVSKENIDTKDKFSFKGISAKIKDLESVYVPWSNQIDESEFIDLSTDCIKVVEERHLNGKFKWLDFGAGRKYDVLRVVVRENSSGSYDLVSGFAAFIMAKIHDRSVKAYVTELSTEDFFSEFGIKENNL